MTQSEIERERARNDAIKSMVTNKLLIIEALKRAGAKVVHPDDLSTDYSSEIWEVNGEMVSLRCRLEYDGVGMWAKETGKMRFYVGRPYPHRDNAFVQRTSAAAVAKFPRGFDFDAIAEALIDGAKERADRHKANKVAEDRAAVAEEQAGRLRKEFGLDKYGGPLDRTEDLLKLTFTRLTEDQARALLGSARALGLLPVEEE